MFSVNLEPLIKQIQAFTQAQSETNALLKQNNLELSQIKELIKTKK